MGPRHPRPAIIVSPYARKGYVDHTQYDTTSILKLIETRWNLAPLGTRDAAATALTNAFDFQAEAPVPAGMPRTGISDNTWVLELLALVLAAIAAATAGVLIRDRNR